MPAVEQYFPSSYLFGGNALSVEEGYESYLDNSQSVPEGWRLSEQIVEAFGKLLDYCDMEL